MNRAGGGDGRRRGYVRTAAVPGWFAFLLVMTAPLALLVLASLAAAAVALGAVLALPFFWRRSSRQPEAGNCIELDPTQYRRIDPEPPPRLRDR